MVSGVLFSLVCALCVILIPAVWADDCSSYVDSDGNQHNTQQCGIYCCGNCQKQYCCNDKTNRFRRSKQKLCEGSLAKLSNPIPILGIILGSVSLIICVVVIVCCVIPCCFFYKKCRKGRNQRPRTARNTPTVVNVPQQPQQPQQPHPPPGYHPSYPGYLFVPAQPGYGGVPLPSAPPLYFEATDPACSPSAYTPGLPMASYPGQPYAPPPHSEEFAPLPYNPFYGPDP